MSPASPPDIDRILEAIRAEARARGSRSRAHSADVPGGAAVQAGGIPMPDVRHVADLLALPLDAFLPVAYRHLLGREPDATGLAHYQRALLRGSLARAEVLGRLALSPEGRRHAGAIPGLLPAFALAMLYRVPVAGPIAALAARLLCLPAYLRERSSLEAAALASGAWLKR